MSRGYRGVYRIVLSRQTRDGVHQVIHRVHTRRSTNTAREEAIAGLTVLTGSQREQAQEYSWDWEI